MEIAFWIIIAALAIHILATDLHLKNLEDRLSAQERFSNILSETNTALLATIKIEGLKSDVIARAIGINTEEDKEDGNKDATE